MSGLPDVTQLVFVDCPLCERDDCRPRITVNGYKLVECKRCGLVYVNPRKTDVKGIYTEDYFSNEDYYADYEASRKAFRIGFRSKLRILKRYVGGGRLLDVGCAFGDFMDEAKAFGFSPYGVEVSPGAAKIASDVGPVCCGDWLEFRTESPFDVVTFIDSLEHFENPVKALQKASEVLFPGGLVAAMVPNIGSWFARLMGRRWHLILPEEHLVYFTPTTMRQVLEREGFQVLHEGTGSYGRTLGDVAAVLFRGTGWGRSLADSVLRRIVFEINLGDLFVVARKVGAF